jgi:hypothetical protein
MSPIERQLSHWTYQPLSEDSLGLSSSHEIRPRSAPLPIPCLRPLPDDIAALVRLVAAKLPTRSVHVVSHHFDGLLRIQTSGLLHPETG